MNPGEECLVRHDIGNLYGGEHAKVTRGPEGR